MHIEAYEFVSRWASCEPALRVAELGSRRTSPKGPQVRDLFAGTSYVGVDAVPGEGVDVVANGADWRPAEPVDLVLCCEVFEHTPHWRAIVANAFAMLKRGGRAVFTCAGPGRKVHGLNHDDPDCPGHYANLTAAELHAAMLDAGFARVSTATVPHRSTRLRGSDVHATGVRP